MTESSDVKDKDAQSDDDIFKECADRFTLASDYESQNRKNAIEALKFEDGDQWPDDIANNRKLENRPALTINTTRTFCSRVINNLKQQRPRIKCHPVGDGADVDKAEVVNGLIRHIENSSNSSIAYDWGAQSAVKAGWGYWRVVSEYLEKSFDQELVIKGIRNPLTVYMDPAAVLPDGSDQMWCIVSEKMTRIEFKRKYPKADPTPYQGDGVGDEQQEWESKTHIRLAEYFRIKEKRQKLYLLSDGSTKYQSEMPAPETMQAANLQVVDERDDAMRTVQWFRVNGRKVVDQRELKGQWIPVIRCEGDVTDLNGEIRRKGMVKDMMNPAQMFNYWRTAETEVVALAPKAPWVVAEGQTDGHPEWFDANQKSYSTLVYKDVVGAAGQPLAPPQRQRPGEIPAGIVNAAEGAKSDLMMIAGMPHEPGADSDGQVISGRAIQRRQGLSDQTHFQYFDNQTLSIRHTGRILLDLIPYYYDTPRMQRIIGADGVPQMVGINQPQQDPQMIAIEAVKNDMKVGKYDVVMDTGPGYQTKREEGAEAMMGLLNTPLGELVTKVGPDLVVRNMDFAGADDLADRLVATTPEGMDKAVQQLPKQAQAIVGGLQAQLKEAQATIQQQALEIKYKSQIELGWMHVEREKSKMNAEVKVHDTEIRGHTARDVAEIQAGATLLNTHAEADHEQEAAKLLLQSAKKAETEH